MSDMFHGQGRRPAVDEFKNVGQKFLGVGGMFGFTPLFQVVLPLQVSKIFLKKFFYLI